MAVVGIAKERAGSPGPLMERKDGMSITRVFTVETDSRATGGIEVGQAVGLPQKGNIYLAPNESHPYLFCTRRNIRRLNDRSRFWTVECEYESPELGNKDQQQPNPGAPEFDLPIIRVGSHSELRDIVKDRDGNPIVNSAGTPFKPHPKKEVFFPTLTIQRNEPITTPLGQTQLAFLGKTNSDTFWGLGEDQWRCVRLDGEIASRTTADGIQHPYVAVVYEFQAKDDWALEMLDEGPNHIVGGKPVAFKTADGTPYVDFLDGSTGAQSATPHYLTFDYYDQAEFAALNLPQSFLAAVP